MLSVRIKELRLAHNLTQVDLAKKLSIAKQTVSNWENDNIQPSVDMLMKIADFFGVTTDYLLGRDTDNSLDISLLTGEETAHIRMIISDIAEKRKND